VDAAAVARRELDLLGQLYGSELEIAELLISELINNSVVHAGPRASAEIELDAFITPAMVSISVTDDGGGFAAGARQAALRSDDAHWGLQLVEGLADRWGIEDTHGTTVWFELDR
jgi:serine/threonine-protein kinase RsbW